MAEPTDLERDVARAIAAVVLGRDPLPDEEIQAIITPEPLMVEEIARAAIATCFRWKLIETAPKEMHAKAWLWRKGWIGPVLGEMLYGWALLTQDGDLAKDSDGDPIDLDPSHWAPLPPLPEDAS